MNGELEKPSVTTNIFPLTHDGITFNSLEELEEYSLRQKFPTEEIQARVSEILTQPKINGMPRRQFLGVLGVLIKGFAVKELNGLIPIHSSDIIDLTPSGARLIRMIINQAPAVMGDSTCGPFDYLAVTINEVDAACFENDLSRADQQLGERLVVDYSASDFELKPCIPGIRVIPDYQLLKKNLETLTDPALLQETLGISGRDLFRTRVGMRRLLVLSRDLERTQAITPPGTVVSQLAKEIKLRGSNVFTGGYMENLRGTLRKNFPDVAEREKELLERLQREKQEELLAREKMKENFCRKDIKRQSGTNNVGEINNPTQHLQTDCKMCEHNLDNYNSDQWYTDGGNNWQSKTN